MQFLILAIFVAFMAVTFGEGQRSKMRVMERQIVRDDFIRRHRSNPSTRHEVIVAVKKNNLDYLEQLALERATPGHPSYQKWMTYDEVTEIIQNEEGYERVRLWLEANNIEITWTGRRKDYLRAVTTIGHWESLLNAEFFEHEDRSWVSRKGTSDAVHRASTYSIPEEFASDIFAIFNTVQTPPPYLSKYHTKQPSHPKYGSPFRTNLRFTATSRASSPSSPDGTKVTDGIVDVAFLNSFYNITTNTGSSSASLSQSVFETEPEYFSTDDLTQFQQTYCLLEQSAVSVGGHSLTTCPSTSSNTEDCFEGNLDIQYIMGVAQVTTSIFWWVTQNSGDDPFLTWIQQVGQESDPPKVNSISYGATENYESASVMSSFNSEAAALSLLGVTITASAGDNGAPGTNCYCNLNSGSSSVSWAVPSPWTGKGYFPSFPATSPYVTAVGATQGPEQNEPEIACQSQLGGLITTGGGFSTYFSRPSWQNNAVNHYLQNMSSTLSAGYNSQGRAYPDISLIGVDYQVVVGGIVQSVFGTSCSSPVFAGMISLLNAQRELKGLGPLGWLNPTLYSYGWNTSAAGNLPLSANQLSAVFNDVTSGNNKCCATQVPANAQCCAAGFQAIPGWDPVTGWGSVQFTELGRMFGVDNIVETGQPFNCTYDPDIGKINIQTLSQGAIIAISVVGSLCCIACIGGLIAMCVVACCGRRASPPLSGQQELSQQNAQQLQQASAVVVQPVHAPRIVHGVRVQENPIQAQ